MADSGELETLLDLQVDSADRRLFLDVVRPRVPVDLPLVVYLHGGGW